MFFKSGVRPDYYAPRVLLTIVKLLRVSQPDVLAARVYLGLRSRFGDEAPKFFKQFVPKIGPRYYHGGGILNGTDGTYKTLRTYFAVFSNNMRSYVLCMVPRNKRVGTMFLNPFRTPVPFWGQTT